MKILVTGGCGYVGSVLVLKLLSLGHEILIVDTQWFGNFLPEQTRLRFLKKTVGEITISDLDGVYVVIHLANIANDPSVELNPTFSWEINVLQTTQLLEVCKEVDSVKKFIFASSGSVYGIKKELRVSEELELVPMSTYNKTKMAAERICLSYREYFDVICIRPATVCGVSPRMRFDVVVNMFVLQAYTNKKITVLGGDQIRPNIHIDDLVSVYQHFIENEFGSGIYNAGFENVSVLEIARLVKNWFVSDIEIKTSNDPRSYRQDSSKLLSTGFKPKKGIMNAIEEVGINLQIGKIRDDDRWHTVKWMASQMIGKL